MIEKLNGYSSPTSQMRLVRMHGKHEISYADMRNSSEWQKVSTMIADLDSSPWMEMDV